MIYTILWVCGYLGSIFFILSMLQCKSHSPWFCQQESLFLSFWIFIFHYLLLVWKNFTEMSTDMWVYREHKNHLLQVWLIFLSDTVQSVWVFKFLILLKYLSIFIPIFLSAFFQFPLNLNAASLLSSDWDILTRKSKTHLFGPFYGRAKFQLVALLCPTWPACTLW